MAAIAWHCLTFEPPQLHPLPLMDLSGTWTFELDREDRGIAEGWFNRPLAQTIRLPGSLQEQGYGDDISVDTPWTGDIVDRSWFTEPRYGKFRQPGNIKVPFWLQPEKYYKGVAWFQRSIEIPMEWQGKRITLTLERPHWETRVWVDDREVGTQTSLSTPHVYELGPVTPGSHRLTIRVDNREIVNVGPNAHSITDHTQTNWNGIVGRIELAAGNPLWIDDVQVYPDLARRLAAVQVRLKKTLPGAVEGTLTVQASAYNTEHGHAPAPKTLQLRLSGHASLAVVDYPLGAAAQLWDEFNPVLYRLTVSLAAGGQAVAERTASFGMREIRARGTQIAINGRKTFLRGTLECCVFPLTGYPPTDVESWKRIIRVCRAHGLNHIRFHSYCPPRAAFIAADELGFYYHVECAAWANQGASIGEGTTLDQWLYDEAARIISAYGNHPSFLMMAYGNEPAGDDVGYLTRWVTYWKQRDPRRLYTSGAGWPVIPMSDYHSTYEPRIHPWGAGITSRINACPPETVTDYADYVRKWNAPIISHEIGQWCAYPNFDEIEKYTGVLKARNFEVFRETLAENYMDDQAHDFLMASGRLQALCYKEEIESALRTRGFGGFQLLGLHDFPGQGTALVGVLDPFWDEKGYLTASEFRRFCNSTVPLARMSKRAWHTGETFRAKIEAAHFGPQPLVNATLAWRLATADGATVASGRLPPATLPVDNGLVLGAVEIPLRDLTPARKYVFSVGLEGTPFENDWDIWVFAPQLELPAPADVLVTDRLDNAARAHLGQGGRVLFMPAAPSINTPVQIGFSSVFWNTAWTRNQPPHTLGILCDPRHPVFSDFPTEYHSNWQWWELIHGSAAMVIDHLPRALRPLVQPIDTWFENRRLGLLFEARVDGGKLMVCSMDLRTGLANRLVARQMRYSLLRYMSGERFNPEIEVDLPAVQALLRTPE